MSLLLVAMPGAPIVAISRNFGGLDMDRILAMRWNRSKRPSAFTSKRSKAVPIMMPDKKRNGLTGNCFTCINKKLVVTSASLLVTSALLVVTRTLVVTRSY